jgi:hypothetical protein
VSIWLDAASNPCGWTVEWWLGGRNVEVHCGGCGPFATVPEVLARVLRDRRRSDRSEHAIYDWTASEIQDVLDRFQRAAFIVEDSDSAVLAELFPTEVRREFSRGRTSEGECEGQQTLPWSGNGEG